MVYLPSASSLNPMYEVTSSSVIGSSSGRAAKTIILAQIVASERTQNNISLVYKESLRAMIRIFNELFYINSESRIVNIKCVHANPERTIAKLKQENNIILPIVSIA